jgi:hypothetical protein
MHEREHGHAHAQSTQQNEDVVTSAHRHSSTLAAPANPIESGIVMRKARDANGVADGAEAAVGAASASAGSALPGPLMRKFESSLGADLSSVRVHTGGESATAASAVGARAYTIGQDIHFGAGQYDPSSAGGQHLLAHEVAHTVQQRGGAPTRQNKLEVSQPHDAHEHEADRAADAMVSGAPAFVTSAAIAPARKEAVDPSSGQLLGAGDEAQQKAWQTPLSIDKLSVDADRSRVGELVEDIKKQDANLTAAAKAEWGSTAEHAIATNAATRTNLAVFNDKLDVSNVDTTAFMSQFRYAYADYQRLIAEAQEYTTSTNRTRGNDPIGTVGIEHEHASGLNIAASPQSQRFRAARANLNTAAKKMDSQMTKVRGAANSLQGAIYKARAAAAAAQGAEAAKKLADLNKEISDVAKGVSTVVKIASAVGGLAGGGGATNAMATATANREGGPTAIAPSDWGKHAGFGATHAEQSPEEHSKAALIQAMGTDLASLGGGGDLAETLVTAIGKYANKETIGGLQATITKKAAEEASFKVAGDTLQMIGYQQTLEGEAGSLMVLQQAFAGAKTEERAAAEDLMALLEKSGGPTGKKQSRAVLFLSDADRFLAQVETAISAGKNQQDNLKSAAEDRKKLRGTSAALGEKGVGKDNEEASTQQYYRCHKQESKGMLWGTNTTYRLERVFVRFQDNGTVHQGGAGTIEGHGSTEDEVFKKIETLKKAKAEVQQLQTRVQNALGLGGPGLNA